MTDLTKEQESALVEALENHPGVLSVADKRLTQALKERDEARTALETARMKLRIVEHECVNVTAPEERGISA